MAMCGRGWHIDADTKLAISYLVGGRDSEYAMALMDDLRQRVTTRMQLTTDGHTPYLQAVEDAFGADVDYAMLVKLYGAPLASPEAARRYSPSECLGARKDKVTGEPGPAPYLDQLRRTAKSDDANGDPPFHAADERIQQKGRESLRTLSRSTSCVRRHQTTRVTPAMAAGLTQTWWNFSTTWSPSLRNGRLGMRRGWPTGLLDSFTLVLILCVKSQPEILHALAPMHLLYRFC